MRYTWIDEYLLSKAGVKKDLQKDWNWIRYQIGGKMFAAVCLGQNNEPYYITLKLEPSEGDFLRQQYEDIIPGYYMNKIHWNSIKPDGEVPDDLLKDLLDKSYQLVLNGFSKKKQREILESSSLESPISCCGADCECLPCDIWRNAKGPSFSDEEFKRDIQEQVTRLGGDKRTMPFDYKKEYKEFYMPKNKPSIVEVPPMNYIAVRGKGNPNAEDSEYKQSIGLLYGIAFTIKMSKKGDHQIEGYFDYVVPPLEGFWWQVSGAQQTSGCEPAGPGGGTNGKGIDYSRKEDFNFISLIRLPDFVTKEDFDWALEEAAKKKKEDFSKVEFLTYDEGLCVQCMHIGPYDDEPATVEMMHDFMIAEGYELDITDKRFHHEIYLSDARRVAPEKLKTVIRHPVKKI